MPDRTLPPPRRLTYVETPQRPPLVPIVTVAGVLLLLLTIGYQINMAPPRALRRAAVAPAMDAVATNQLLAASSPPVPTATSTTAPATPPPLPAGYTPLPVEVHDAGWAPEGGERFALAQDTPYQFVGERIGPACRVRLLDGAQPWVPCPAIGQPAPTSPPPPPPPPTPAPPPPTVCASVRAGPFTATACGYGLDVLQQQAQSDLARTLVPARPTLDPAVLATATTRTEQGFATAYSVQTAQAHLRNSQTAQAVTPTGVPAQVIR